MAPPRKIRVDCKVEGCDKLSAYGDYCSKHYKRFWRYGNPETILIAEAYNGRLCKEEGCETLAAKNGWCEKHNARWQRNGSLELNRRENGTGGLNSDGYHAFTIDGERLLEHRMIAEKALGKPLPPGAVVHHITEDRTDNHGPFKLVICPDQGYHLLIHRLMREKGISFKEGWPN